MTRGLPAFTAGGVMRKRGPPAEFGAINLRRRWRIQR